MRINHYALTRTATDAQMIRTLTTVIGLLIMNKHCFKIEYDNLLRKETINKWLSLLIGIWLFIVPLVSELLPELHWVKVKDTKILYFCLTLFIISWIKFFLLETTRKRLLKNAIAFIEINN